MTGVRDIRALRDAPCVSRGNRPGGALVAALALLALSAALLGGSAAAGRRAARSATTYNAMLLAELEAMAVVSEVIADLEVGSDTLAVGGERMSAIGGRMVGANGMPARAAVRVVRLSERRYVVAVDCSIGPDDAVIARRRIAAFLDRPPVPDTLAALPSFSLLPRWAVAELY